MPESRHPSAIGRPAYDAVIFDLDGVVTPTAEVHARAWKRLFDDVLREHAARTGEPFVPFDQDADYKRHVDGKPRYDGVQAFLRSRGVELPWGDPGDDPARETVCGLGNRKNRYFEEHLHAHGVTPYASTVALIARLHAHGFKTAIISASRNAAAVLEAAGVRDLFAVKLDGADAERMGIKGKPAPDMFVKAAELLAVEPARAVVVEDAIAGCQAARAGRFGLVVGVDRIGDGAALEANGADLVVRDLAELAVEPDLPLALDHVHTILRLAGGRRLAVFLDYDGTLTPIVARPELAVLSEAMRQAVRELTARCTVAIISGRDLADVRDMVKLADLIYAGSHGFDVSGPGVERQTGTEFTPSLDRAAQALHRHLDGIEGVLIERKRFAIAVHYRLVAPDQVGAVQGAVHEVARRAPDLRTKGGKKVFELQPDIPWDKGRAVLALLETLGLGGADTLALYLGDDVTDEDAFRALRGGGVGIVVWEAPHPTAAAYRLPNPAAVEAFLRRLADALGERR